LKDEEQNIEAFDKQFAEMLNLNSKPNAFTIPPVTKPYQPPPKAYPSATTSPPNQQLFPPGYTPPHLIKPLTPDGFASDEQLKLHANHTKK
jgi:hypothetical protein